MTATDQAQLDRIEDMLRQLLSLRHVDQADPPAGSYEARKRDALEREKQNAERRSK